MWTVLKSCEVVSGAQSLPWVMVNCQCDGIYSFLLFTENKFIQCVSPVLNSSLILLNSFPTWFYFSLLKNKIKQKNPKILLVCFDFCSCDFFVCVFLPPSFLPAFLPTSLLPFFFLDLGNLMRKERDVSWDGAVETSKCFISTTLPNMNNWALEKQTVQALRGWWAHCRAEYWGHCALTLA